MTDTRTRLGGRWQPSQRWRNDKVCGCSFCLALLVLLNQLTHFLCSISLFSLTTVKRSNNKLSNLSRQQCFMSVISYHGEVTTGPDWNLRDSATPIVYLRPWHYKTASSRIWNRVTDSIFYGLVWFNGISTIVSYLMPKPSVKKYLSVSERNSATGVRIRSLWFRSPVHILRW